MSRGAWKDPPTRRPKTQPPEVVETAVLGTDKQILAIIHTLPPKKPGDSPHLIPIPPGVDAEIGWIWTGITFKSPKENAR